MSAHRVFGIRHHGPGSATSLVQAFDAWQPDCVIVEGPPEANDLISAAVDPAMVPPVALLAYASDAPGRAVFYPFASFSPEWLALRWALGRGVPVRFFDLPLAHQLHAPEPPAAADLPEVPAAPPTSPSGEPEAPAVLVLTAPPGTEVEASESAAPEGQSNDAASVDPGESADPTSTAWEMLCEAAGFADAEALWDRLVESQGPGANPAEALFDAVLNLMAELRAASPEPRGREARREAHMRQQIRAALKEGHRRIAVVCGAWHAPVLADVAAGARADAAVLKGLPKTKVTATWVPWTHGRLATRSGYGAGVDAPGWYHHRFTHGPQALERWVTEAAQVFRRHDFAISSAHAIEAVRLSRALTALRGYHEPSLSDTLDAIEGVFCDENKTPLAYLSAELLVGERLGTVPDTVPEPALARAIRDEQKRLRLKVEPGQKTLDLDLREDNGRSRSVLFHRLNLLGIPWARLQATPKGKSRNTFHEIWTLAWEPQMAVAVVEAGRHGTTLPAAVAHALDEMAKAATDIPSLAGLLHSALLADAGSAVPEMARRLDALAAGSTDVPALIGTLVTLGPVLRYGDVRQTDTAALGKMLTHYAARACIGLGTATSGIADEVAEALAPQMGPCTTAIRQVGVPEDWLRAVRIVAESPSTHPLVAGRAARLLLSENVLTADDVGTLLSQALSPGVAVDQARWLEGLLAEGSLFLLHHPDLLARIDAWLTGVSGDAFEAVLPLLRRSFGVLTGPERRQLAQSVLAGSAAPGSAAPTAPDLDWSLGPAVLPFLSRLLRLETAV